MGLSWCNLVLTVLYLTTESMADQPAWSLREHVVGDTESAYGINQLPHKTVLASLQKDCHVFSHLRPRTCCRGRRECLWYWSGPTQNSVSIPPRGWRGHLAPSTPNTSSGTPRVLITSISPHTKSCYHPPSRVELGRGLVNRQAWMEEAKEG
ncbi:hypothetical protein C8R44DRAFT_764223 [Mycena epipterygia]|nr:hypothetical protein C8R44DRAFT_764223 [Mycena epipterygia]